MRFRSLALSCLPLTLYPLVLHGRFQEPAKEELQMTDDPKSPGVAAVYLDITEETDDPLHYHSFYARVKVLQEKGKELATVTIPYQRGNFKVTDIKGRTIHADGTVIPLTVKPEDLRVQSGGGQRNRADGFYALRTLEGAAFRVSVSASLRRQPLFVSLTGNCSANNFVHKAHYAFTPFGGFLKGSASNSREGKSLVDSRGTAVNSLIWWPLLAARRLK